ncbi:hypothetical protein A3C87_03810 [Candidatus Kaiserbacteria bacterium RIFCSPHIGHO2_02_FULL_49_34]|uniref:DUF3892 domain-containing protein n=1 Tax=Candidatus Kaiserbacteria bacterium RIFCSPHIGHO2_02_FULL_49_34 TaxID=1798491 RepID=A0A1F6DIN6_9BACT|nr:MAG: hypothetical protein A3C87_03810 [Candidatus Kaiserbacteria bacterium RIFCSPHIGHO2_02_FULL_49_34]
MWEDNSTLNKGTTTRQNMFDWIVNKKGIAYVEDRGNKIPVYGAVTPDGKKYIRTVRDNAWTDELLNLDGF